MRAAKAAVEESAVGLTSLSLIPFCCIVANLTGLSVHLGHHEVVCSEVLQ